jgi:hypothetical protein
MGGSYTFELILNEDGTIDYLYHTLQHGTPEVCTVGIENATGTDGIQCTFNGSGPFLPETGTALRILPVGLPLEPVDDLIVSLSGDSLMEHVVLSWSPAQCAQAYHVYRSTTNPGSGYLLLGSTTDTTYVDTDAVVGESTSFYYVTAGSEALDSSVTQSISPYRFSKPVIHHHGTKIYENNPDAKKTRR